MQVENPRADSTPVKVVRPDSTHADSVRTATKAIVVKGLKKTLKVLSFLNYSDRCIDRPLSGIKIFEHVRGKLINHITVKILLPYGVNLDSPDVYHPNRFQKFTNSMQTKTKAWVIRNELLFKEGDTIEPISLADSERNLWAKDIYKDIKFVITKVDSKSVDILVLIRDKWNWGLSFNLDYNKARLGLQFNNLFGFPQVIGAYLSLNFNPDNRYSFQGFYRFSNIHSTHLDISLGTNYDKYNKGGNVTVSRSFFSAHSHWAGSIYLGINKQSAIKESFTSAPILTGLIYNSQDFWLAHSFDVTGALSRKIPLLRLVISARFKRTDFTTRPFLHNASNSLNFVNYNYKLVSIGFARWDYYVARNVYKLNEQEYFTKGLNAALISGLYEDEELGNRIYMGVNLNLGTLITPLGYWLTSLNFGGFPKPHTIEEVLIDWRNYVYTHQMPVGKCNLRHFFGSICKLGVNRPAGKEILVNNDNGIRGLYSTSLRGKRSFSFSYDIVFSPPPKRSGFTTAFFAFTDISVLQKESWTDHYLTTAIGFGLRVRNLNFGINYLEFLFAYYPALHVPEQSKFYFAGSGTNDHVPIKNDLFQPNILSTDPTNGFLHY